MDFKNKYFKYKYKYLNLRKQIGGDICEGRKIIVSEAPDLEFLLDHFFLHENGLITIDKKNINVHHLFWKKIIKMIADCSYDTIIFQYKQMGILTDEKLESLNLLNDKNFLEKKEYELKYPRPKKYNEIEIIIKFIEDFYFVFTDNVSNERKMYILVEETDKIKPEQLNNYQPISILTVWDHNPSDENDNCDYYIGNFCTTPEKRNKGCGRFLLENILKKLNGEISLEVDKEDPRHNIKSHDSLVKYYKTFGFKIVKDKEDTSLMKKINNVDKLKSKKELNLDKDSKLPAQEKDSKLPAQEKDSKLLENNFSKLVLEKSKKNVK